MNILLLHNANAGSGDQPNRDELVRLIRDAGHTVVYEATTEKGAEWTFRNNLDAVIAAGGDGTARKAALAMAGSGIPLGILPLGTANNIAKSFGSFAPLPAILQALHDERRRRLNTAIAAGSWGTTRFIESAGAGLLARLIAGLAADTGETPSPSVAAARAVAREIVTRSPESVRSVWIDGREIKGPFLLAEAMNIQAAGPNLCFAPQADPGDGLLDVVLVSAKDRGRFAAFLHDPDHADPPGEVIRGKALEIEFTGPVHADDFTWTPTATGGSRDLDQIDSTNRTGTLERASVRISGESLEIIAAEVSEPL